MKNPGLPPVKRIARDAMSPEKGQTLFMDSASAAMKMSVPVLQAAMQTVKNATVFKKSAIFC